LVSLKILWKPFDREFGDVIDSFRAHRENVEREAELSHMIEAGSERAMAKSQRDTDVALRKGWILV
jgi:hypothetical protein